MTVLALISIKKNLARFRQMNVVATFLLESQNISNLKTKLKGLSSFKSGRTEKVSKKLDIDINQRYSRLQLLQKISSFQVPPLRYLALFM